MKFISSIIAISILATPSFGAFSLDLQADRVQTQVTGTSAPSTTLVLLLADTDANGFGAAGVTSIGTGSGNVFGSGLFLDGSDDLILWRGDLSVLGAGGLFESVSGLSTGVYGSKSWDFGDPLGIAWFPTLDLSDTMTIGGSAYGLFSTVSPLDGSSAWTTPADLSADYPIYAFTMNGINVTGSNPNSALVASLTVAPIPEPGEVGLVLGLAALGLLGWRRRKAG